MTAYEPGTVAAATVRGVPDVRVMRGDGIFGSKWYTNRPVSGSLTSFTDFEVTDIRPLVVLDPEDRQAIAGLLDAARAHLAKRGSGADIITRLSYNTDAMQAALLGMTAPPKPAEPTGLGAVVEDSEGFQWVRIGERDWYCEPRGNKFYGHINVVRVLSEGVTS